VINEEMYEEEDDDLPTQYQRLNAHLHTTSVMFNKKLHDYIATQHGVRNMFMSQYQNPSFQQYGGQQYSPQTAAFPQANNWLNPSMLPPQQFNPASPQLPVTQQAQPMTPNGVQQQSIRHSPYPQPQRLNSHQRALSIQLPQTIGSVEAAPLSAPGGATTPQESLRRMSLPAHALVQPSRRGSDGKARSTNSRTSTTQSPVQSTSPRVTSSPTASGQTTPQLHIESETPASYPYSVAGYPFTSQALNANPLTMSMPPESQQFIGSALDMSDPRQAMFMAGSDNLPQPFAATYTYNPNFSGKASRPSTADETLARGYIKSETADGPTTMPSEGFFNNEALFTPGNGDYNAFFDFPSTDFAQPADEQGDGSNFVNWD
jgi:hypothetical protein